MNSGAFGENFPYSNFHDLNMDWIIKIAKDFLDQYTHIQEVISSGEQSLTELTENGLEQLQNKADALEALLQAWYDTHSEDIANELRDALAEISAQLESAVADFGERAEEKAQQTLESIPEDYTTVSNIATALRRAFPDSLVHGTLIEREVDIEEHSLQNINKELVFADNNRNTVLEVGEYANIKTAQFDSLNKSEPDILPYLSTNSLIVMDKNGNVGFKNKNNPLTGKKVSIIGDSISSYDGYIPTGYAHWYPNGNVSKVDYTWWHQLIKETGMTLLVNASWSGSGVTGNSQGNAKCACSNARIADLSANGENPDIIIVYITSNDWANEPQHETGSFTSTDTIPVDGTIATISNGYALMLYKIRTTYPQAQVFCVTNLEGRTTDDTTYPIVNDYDETIYQVNTAISEIAHIFGAYVIDLQTCGIHYWNIASYTVDGKTHPNKKGMSLIANTIKTELENNYHIKGGNAMGSVVVLKNADFSKVNIGTSPIQEFIIPEVITDQGALRVNSQTGEIEHYISESSPFTSAVYTTGEITVPTGAKNLYGIIPITVVQGQESSVINASDDNPYDSQIGASYMFYHRVSDGTWNRRNKVRKTFELYKQQSAFGNLTVLLGRFKLSELSTNSVDKIYLQWVANKGDAEGIGLNAPILYWEF